MSHQISLSALLLTLMGLLTVQADAEDKVPKRVLEGTWELVSLARDGKDVQVQKNTRLVVTGDTFVVMVGDRVISSGTNTLDPSKTPAAIDSTYTEGPDKGKSFKGIYKSHGEILTFCRAGSPDQARPTEFKTDADSRRLLSVYRRVTK